MRSAKLAAAAGRLKQRSGAGAPFSLAFLCDVARAPHPELIARVLPPGAAFILRSYDAPRRAPMARRLQAICARRRVLLIIGADAGLARNIGAAGVHVPSWAAMPADPQGLIVTAACHSAGELERAASAGADLALLGPVFPTASHPGAQALGPERFKEMAAAARLPVLALGGIDEANAHVLAGPNVAGLAAIGAFLPR